MRSQYPHAGLRLVRLVGEGEEDELDEYGQQQNDDTVVAEELAQEGEDRDYDKGVDPAEELVTQRHQFVEVEGLVARTAVVIRRQQGIRVGTQEDVKPGYLRLFRVVVDSALGVEPFQVFSLFDGLGSEGSVVELAIGNEGGREELVLETNPFETGGCLLVVVARLAQVLDVVAGKLVVQGTVTLFEHATLLLTAHRLVPDEIPVNYTGGNHPVHILLPDVHLQHVAVLGQGVANTQPAAIGQCEGHVDRAVIHHRLEIEVAGINYPGIGAHDKAVVVLIAGEESHLRRVVGHIVVEHSLVETAALIGKFQGHLVVGECGKLFGTLGTGSELAKLSHQPGLMQRIGHFGRKGIGLSRSDYLSGFGHAFCLDGSNRVVVPALSFQLLGGRLHPPREEQHNHYHQYKT